MCVSELEDVTVIDQSSIYLSVSLYDLYLYKRIDQKVAFTQNELPTALFLEKVSFLSFKSNPRSW